MKRSQWKIANILLSLLFTQQLSLELSANPLSAQNVPALKVDSSGIEEISVGHHMAVASDKKVQMDIESILEGKFNDSFKYDSKSSSASFGANRPWPHWVIFEIENETSEKRSVFLESAYVATDFIELSHFSPDNELLGKTTLGDNTPFLNRDVEYRTPVFQLDLLPGINRFVMKVNTSSIVVIDLKLYEPKAFHNEKIKESIFVGILVGGVAIIFFYNLFLYTSTKDKNYAMYVIYVGSYLLFALGYYGIAPYFGRGENEIPLLNQWGLYVLIDGITTGACLFSISFLGLKERSRIFYRILQFFVIAAIANALVALLSQGEVAITRTVTVALSFLMGPSLVAAGIKRLISGYKPALYFSSAWMFVIGGNTLVILSSSGVLERNFITSWGQLIGANMEMLLLSFALGARINLIKSEKLKAERLALQEAQKNKELQHQLIESQKESIRTLDAKVKERTRDIGEILANIEQGIFTIRPDLILGEEFSDYLTRLLRSNNIGGQGLEEVILSKTNLSSEAISKTLTCLEFSLGENLDVSWETNKDSLPNEFEIEMEGAKHIIEIDWCPMADENGDIEKILVTMRDVTEVRALKQAAFEQNLRNNMLLEMLSNDLNKTHRFLERAGETKEKFKQLAGNWASSRSEVSKELLSIAHTFKGNARSMRFTSLSETLHSFEDSVNAFKEDPSKPNMTAFISSLQKVIQLIDDYQNLYGDKFSNLNGNLQQQTSVQLGEYIYRELQPVVEVTSKELDKNTPSVEVTGDFQTQDTKLLEDISDMFAHIVRNSIDHGLESNEQRIISGKPERGCLKFELETPNPQSLIVRYSDDGAGLDLSRIYHKALSKGLIEANCKVDEILEMIFTSGFSTSETTTMVSGRGVGMDAVRRTAQQRGGSLRIILNDSVNAEEIYKNTSLKIAFRFELVIPVEKGENLAA